MAFLLSLKEGVTALFPRWSEGVRCLPPLFQRRGGPASVEVRGPSSLPPCSQRRSGWPSLHSFREGERALFHRRGDGAIHLKYFKNNLGAFSRAFSSTSLLAKKGWLTLSLREGGTAPFQRWDEGVRCIPSSLSETGWLLLFFTCIRERHLFYTSFLAEKG